MLKLWRRLSSKEFQQMFREGSFFAGHYLSISVIRGSGPAVGFTMKKQKRSAVERNLIRRRLKEAFIKVQEFIPCDWKVVIIGSSGCRDVSIDNMSSEIFRLSRIGQRKKQ